MKTIIEEDILYVCKKSRTLVELMNNVRPIIQEVLCTDEALLSVHKNWCNYGTWRISIFVNPYHFGRNLATSLESISKITHDEEKTFTVNDLTDEIVEAIETFAYDNFS